MEQKECETSHLKNSEIVKKYQNYNKKAKYFHPFPGTTQTKAAK